MNAPLQQLELAIVTASRAIQDEILELSRSKDPMDVGKWQRLTNLHFIAVQLRILDQSLDHI
jgi:hypothetical protein